MQTVCDLKNDVMALRPSSMRIRHRSQILGLSIGPLSSQYCFFSLQHARARSLLMIFRDHPIEHRDLLVQTCLANQATLIRWCTSLRLSKYLARPSNGCRERRTCDCCDLCTPPPSMTKPPPSGAPVAGHPPLRRCGARGCAPPALLCVRRLLPVVQRRLCEGVGGPWNLQGCWSRARTPPQKGVLGIPRHSL